MQLTKVNVLRDSHISVILNVSNIRETVRNRELDLCYKNSPISNSRFLRKSDQTISRIFLKTEIFAKIRSLLIAMVLNRSNVDSAI
jgi:hypothetical protein